MADKANSPGALHGLRVVELTDATGAYAGRLLADLGADVVLVEPPEGCAARRFGPYLHGATHVEQSIFHWWMNASKRSIVVDVSSPHGRQEFARLVRNADLLICSGSPADLAARGIDVNALLAGNPRLVATVITPFGLNGPLRDYRADDLVLLAMGGLLYLAGYPGEHPTAVHGYQSYLAASLFAATGSLVALHAAARSGLGQLVDVAIQDCVAQALETAAQNYDLTGKVRTRIGTGQQDAGFGLFPCKDGLVSVVIGLSGGTGPSSWDAMAQWLADDPDAAVFKEPCWRDSAYRGTAAAKQRFAGVFMRFARTRTKKELYASGQALGLSVSPIATTQDVANDDQLLARGFFVDVEHPELARTIPYPGPPYRLSRTPARIRRRAPMLGEHAVEIRAEMAGVRSAARPTAAVGMPLRWPLDDIRIADFTWVGAGPFATKPFADHGADVIKIESSTRPDPTRMSPPFAGHAGANRSGYFANRNSSKRSICVNLKAPEGLAVARRLIECSDVIFNNFRPGAMQRFGLDYDDVVALKPDIVYAEMPAFGNEGPARNYGGFGAAIAAACGLHNLSGDAEKLPVGTGTHYPDHIINPLHAAVGILAALYHRRLTGEGQRVELAQFESSVNCVGFALLTYLANGEVLVRQGNRDGRHAPRAVLRCAGEDRWCAISVASEVEWCGLCNAVDRADWLTDPRYAQLDARLRHQDELERELESWTRNLDPYDVMQRLQAAGVPAGVVQTAADLIDRDPSLRERHWKYLEHPEMGRALYDGPAFLLGRTPGGLLRPAPLLGQHTHEVLSQVLNYQESEIERMQHAGTLA